MLTVKGYTWLTSTYLRDKKSCSAGRSQQVDVWWFHFPNQGMEETTAAGGFARCAGVKVGKAIIIYAVGH